MINTQEILKHWGLEANPFDTNGKIGRTITHTKPMTEIVDFTMRQVQLGSASAILGKVGDSKSTSVNHAFSILRKQPESYVVIRPLALAVGSLTAPSLLRQIFEAMGSYSPRFCTTSRKQEALKQLVNGFDGQTLILLEEAHFLDRSVIRLVKELNDLLEKVSIILVGHDVQMQTVLKRRDSIDLLRRLENGRIHRPSPLDLEDSIRIIQQRVQLFGNERTTFSEGVISEINKTCKNPLTLLTASWKALAFCAEQGRKEVTENVIRKIS